MCQALRELIEDSRMEGHAAGHATGIMAGIQAMIQENKDAGADEEIIVQKLIKYFSLSEDEAMELVQNVGEH